MSDHIASKDIIIVYPVLKRAYYTAITLPAVLREANHPRVNSVFIGRDNNSNEPPSAAVSQLLSKIKTLPNLIIKTLPEHYAHSSTGALRYVIDHLITDNIKFICKIDNDILVPEGYLDYLLDCIEDHTDIGFLGMQVTGGMPVNARGFLDDIVDAPHIGGVGLFRVEALLSHKLESKNRFYGFTEMQTNARHKGWKACWLSHSRNTNLDKSIWSCQDYYVAQGTSRVLGNPSPVQHWVGSPLIED